MRRRTRIDLGQGASEKVEATLNRKRSRWAARNKDARPEENPFLKAIKPDQELYGDLEERGEELKARLGNLEFGNFPGYFNYRNKAAALKGAKNEQVQALPCGATKVCSGDDDAGTTEGQQSSPTSGDRATSLQENPLEAGLTDERIGCLKEEWFLRRNVLDIGCNRGHITYAIARLYSPRFILGIDIDLKMVNMANKDIHLHLDSEIIKGARESHLERAEQLKSTKGGASDGYRGDPNQFPLSSYISHGPIAIDIGNCDSSSEDKITKFPNNIVFLEHNYVLANDELVAKQKAQFDTIVCLSVTKWIHLNYRDDGLKRFFKRIYNHLKPDGLFILEAQPFDNYGRRKKLSDRLRTNYQTIQFKPDQFDDYLLSKQVGFRKVIHETIIDHQCSGFKRPLKVFQK